MKVVLIVVGVVVASVLSLPAQVPLVVLVIAVVLVLVVVVLSSVSSLPSASVSVAGLRLEEHPPVSGEHPQMQRDADARGYHTADARGCHSVTATGVSSAGLERCACVVCGYFPPRRVRFRSPTNTTYYLLVLLLQILRTPRVP